MDLKTDCKIGPLQCTSVMYVYTCTCYVNVCVREHANLVNAQAVKQRYKF